MSHVDNLQNVDLPAEDVLHLSDFVHNDAHGQNSIFGWWKYISFSW